MKKHTIQSRLLLASLLLISPQIYADDQDREPASYRAHKPQLPPQEEPDFGLFGDWLGAKTLLRKHGVDINFVYKGESVTNLQGGLKRKSGYLDNVDLTIDMNLEKLLGWKGLKLSLYGLGNNGSDPSEFVGDDFATSNLESPNTAKLYQAYLEYRFDERSSVLTGLRDLNADFDTIGSTSTLLNSAFGVTPTLSQSGVNGPSIFPQASLALTFKFKAESNIYFQSGAFNAQAGDADRPMGTHIHTAADHGYLYIWETGYDKGDDKTGENKYGIGAWSYAEPTSTIDGSDEEHNWGFYGIVQHHFTPEFAVFVKHGIANEDLNQFQAATEAGLSYKGALHFRPEDTFSAGYARVEMSNAFKQVEDSTDDEDIIELAYKVNVLTGLDVTLDYQFVRNPGATKEVNQAQVSAIRMEIKF
jgi:porin